MSTNNSDEKPKRPCKGCDKKPMRITQVETPPRPSCIECVEKHLGAAMVMLAEIHDGYSYRLQFVGHLHEAEDESRQWTQLHDLIRQARKAWQQQGTVPDWERLARTLAEVRNDAR
jgi:hypothetical protein